MGKMTLNAEIIRLDSFRTFLSYLPNPDIVLRKSGETMQIFKEMFTDGRIKSLFGIRRGATLNLPKRIVPCNVKEIDELVTSAFSHDFIWQVTRKLMYALAFGFQPVEIVWKRSGPYWIPDYSKKHDPTYFTYTPKGVLTYLSSEGPQEITEPYRILVHRNEGDAHDDFYGVSEFAACYWMWQFKRMGFQFWVTATERFAGPSILAIFETDDESKAKERAVELANIISEIQSGSSGALANVKSIQQINMRGAISEFRILIDTCNAELSYTLTGQTLATGEAEYGTRAQGEVHERVMKIFVEHDAKGLAQTLQTLIDWIVEINYPGQPSPQIEIDTGDYAPWTVVKDAIASQVRFPGNRCTRCMEYRTG
jgi:phage gp29-like protein